MKFTYDYFYSSIPTIDKKKSETEANHCHPENVNYSAYKFYRPASRKYWRSKIDEQINKIQVCIAFFKEYKNSVTSPEEKSAITAAIKCDELEIETLLKRKPTGCVIL